MSFKKYAGLLLATAGLLLGPVMSAQASTCFPSWLRSYTSCFSKSRYTCSYVNYNYNCKSVCGKSYSTNCTSGSGGTTTPPPVIAGSIAITPTGQIAGIGTTISIVAPYTAPANSSAQITLFEDEVPIAVYVIPASSTSGNATFSVDVPSYLDISVFQVQLSYTVTTPSSSGECHDRYDSDCGRSKHHYRHGRECDDDDDDDDGTPVTTVLDSEYLIVVRPGGGGGQSG